MHFDYDIIYVPGKQMMTVDVLSRAPIRRRGRGVGAGDRAKGVCWFCGEELACYILANTVYPQFVLQVTFLWPAALAVLSESALFSLLYVNHHSWGPNDCHTQFHETRYTEDSS